MLLALWCHDTHLHLHKSPPQLSVKDFPCKADRERDEHLCRDHEAEGDFEALLKAITIRVESTHDNWFAGSK